MASLPAVAFDVQGLPERGDQKAPAEGVGTDPELDPGIRPQGLRQPEDIDGSRIKGDSKTEGGTDLKRLTLQRRKEYKLARPPRLSGTGSAVRVHPQKQISCKRCPRRAEGVFCQLSEKELSFLGSSKTMNAYRRGQAIFHEGDVPIGAFCVFSGRVRLSRLGEQGRNITVRLIEPGGLFGYQAILSGRPYPGTAEALEDSILCFVDKNTLLQLMEKSRSLAMAVARQASLELLKAERKIQDMAQQKAEMRIAELLMRLCDGRSDAASGKPGEIYLPRQVLAEMAGTAEETCIRILKRFRRRKLISSRGRKITLLDPKALRELANRTID